MCFWALACVFVVQDGEWTDRVARVETLVLKDPVSGYQCSCYRDARESMPHTFVAPDVSRPTKCMAWAKLRQNNGERAWVLVGGIELDPSHYPTDSASNC